MRSVVLASLYEQDVRAGQEASDEGAMAPADRVAALKKIDAEIEAAERVEAATIDDARDHGITIEYRADAFLDEIESAPVLTFGSDSSRSR